MEGVVPEQRPVLPRPQPLRLAVQQRLVSVQAGCVAWHRKGVCVGTK